MTTVSMREAAKLAGVSRQHIYKLADAGKISVRKELLPGKTGDGSKDYRQLIDVLELARVFGPLALDVSNGPGFQDSSKHARDCVALEAELKAVVERLFDRETQLHDAREREEWLKKQVEELSGTIKLIEHTKESMEDRVIELERRLAQIKKTAKGHIDVLQMKLRNERSRGFWERFFNTKAN